MQRTIAETGAEIVHGQHVMTIPPAVDAAAAAGIPAVATVRDYWPVCYWSDLIHDPSADTLCPACSTSGMRRCIRPRAGVAWPLALPLVPYMQSNLRKQEALARAHRVIGVSSTITADLLARCPGLPVDRVVTIPNPVDIDAIRSSALSQPRRLDRPYVVSVGKLAPNKGTSRLLAAVDRAGLPCPLVVIGDGPDHQMVERWAASGPNDVRLTGWLPREEVLGWLAHADALVFPSRGPESLSRVLLEASALGVPIAAMDTGGTRDIVIHGLLMATINNRPLASRLGGGAQAHVEAHFAADRVVARVEDVYREVTSGHA